MCHIMKIKNKYCKPETRFIFVSQFLLSGSPITVGGNPNPDGGGGAGTGGEYGDDLENGSRFGFWDNFDEDLLNDMDKDEINDLD